MNNQQTRHPPEGQRFSSNRQPANPGRTPTAWMRKILSEKGDDSLQHRERVFRHLIEVATSWEIIVKGRSTSGDPIEVASGRDSVEAAKIILGYDVGLPKKLEAPITVPDGMLTEGRSLLDLVAEIYRHRLVSGEMGEEEFGGMVKSLLSFDQAKMQLLLKLLGKSIAGRTWEEAQALLHGQPVPSQPAPISPEESSCADQGNRHEDVIGDQASPKGCDMASHAPLMDEAPDCSGSAAPNFEPVELPAELAPAVPGEPVSAPSAFAPTPSGVQDDEDDE